MLLRHDDIPADKLTLRRVSIPDAEVDTDDDNEDLPVFHDNIPGKVKKKFKATCELSDVLNKKPTKRMIHIIVQRPPARQY